ncbi:hypothetical protein HYALB_00012237 [Hymenoscyphus albidus]|uniref:Uncharacterized protein n=1 Tax=Hymenoscyphus albidus TaxID=595503 RepID=A0A9N9LM26_9HELO|nr:hypothetical protein HYALB_00012237 [Hymenoscyphus albidus]
MKFQLTTVLSLALTSTAIAAVLPAKREHLTFLPKSGKTFPLGFGGNGDANTHGSLFLENLLDDEPDVATYGTADAYSDHEADAYTEYAPEDDEGIQFDGAAGLAGQFGLGRRQEPDDGGEEEGEGGEVEEELDDTQVQSMDGPAPEEVPADEDVEVQGNGDEEEPASGGGDDDDDDDVDDYEDGDDDE